jgi:small subunit ribosomal protein S9
METATNTVKPSTRPKDKRTHGYSAVAVGRRKEAVARVRLLTGNGQITINGKPIGEYFRGPIVQKEYQKPFEIAKVANKFSATILVKGGGAASQLGAVVHGLSRAVALADTTTRTLLKKEGLLTRDARARERRKYGLAQGARAKKQSPKR